MKHTKQFLFISIVATLITFVISCAKKEGCTDKNAYNYDASAGKNCCCQYKGSVVFWYNQTSGQHLLNAGVTAITFYVDGTLAGSQAASVYWTGAPQCSQAQSITVEKDLGLSTGKTYQLIIQDQNNHELINTFINWTAHTCLAEEITF